MKNVDQSNEKEHCKHTFVANILLEQNETITLDLANKDKIFVVQENPYLVAVVFSNNERQDSKMRPGVIVKTARMTKIRCRTCKGKDHCFHLNTFKLAESENESVETCGSDRLAEKEFNSKKTGIKTDLVDGNTEKKQGQNKIKE